MTRRRKKKTKLNPPEKVNVDVPKNSDRMATDEEALQNGTKKSFWRRCIHYPSMAIDWFISNILWLQLLSYQKIAGRSPLFLEGKGDDSNTALTESKEELENAKRELLCANKELSEQTEHLRDFKVKYEKQEEEVKKLLDQKNELDKKNKEQTDKNTELDGVIKEIRDKNSELGEKNKKQADTNTKLKKENIKQADKIKELDEENVKVERLNKSIQQTNDQKSQQIDSLNKQNTIQLAKIYELSKEIESLGNKARLLQDKLDAEICENSELRDKIQGLTEEKSVLEEEKLDALRRLSEQVSVKLRDNNPNIVDLSDQCRPTKLAEMFSELYDNEWTNAFSVLEDTLTEEQAIVVLLDTVMIAYGFCETKVNEPWQVLTDWFIDESLPGVQQTTKWLKDSRKTNIQKKVSETEKNFSEAILRMCTEESLKTLLSDTDMNLYFTKCIELCLLMVATDPPVVLVCPGWNPINRTADDKQPQHEQEKTHTDQMMEGHNETTSHIDREQGGDHNETESRNNKEPDADRNETTSLNNTEQDYDRDDTASHTDTEQDDDCKDTASHVDTEQDDNCKDTASHADTEQDNDCKDTASHADTKQDDDCKDTASHADTEQDDDGKNNASNTNTEQDDDRNESKSHTNTGQDNDRNETANHYNTEKVEIHLETTRHTNREQDEGHNKTASHTNTDHEGTNMENGGDHSKTASNTNTEQNVDQKETATHNNTEQDGHQNETTSRTNMDQDEGHNETASTNNMQQGEDDGETAKNNSIEQGDVYCIEGDEQEKELINFNTEENQAIGEPQPENQTQHHVKDLDVNDSTGQGITNEDVLDSLTQSLQQDRCQENDQEPVSGESEIANKYDLVNTQQQEDLEGKIMNDNYDKMIESTEGDIDDLSQTTLPDNFVTNGEGVPQTEQEGNTEVQDAQQINRVGSIIIDKTDEPQPQQQAENSADTEFAGDGDTFFGNTADDGEQQEDRTESVTKPEEGPKNGLINGYDGSYRGTAEEDSRDNVHEGKMVHPHLENDAVHTDANKNKDNPGESLSHDLNQERNGNTIVSDEKMKEETPINTEGGHLFDKELFKEYTRRGKYLDFIVWPAMCLHKDGPLLSKGVAQGRKDQYAAKNVTGWTWRSLK